MCAPAAERVAAVVDRVLSLDYATVSPEVQPAQQPESAPHSAYQGDPMHHPDAGPVLNGLYEQAWLTRACVFDICRLLSAPLTPMECFLTHQTASEEGFSAAAHWCK